MKGCSMKITHGLLKGQVLQRNAKNRAFAQISGTSISSGDVEIRILKKDKVVKGFNWKKAGESKAKKFTATLADLKAGGPYSVELKISKEKLTVSEVFVGDVWILAGQSNMQGAGNRVDQPKAHPMVRGFFMRDEWAVAEEPLHHTPEAVDVFHNVYGTGSDRPTEEQLRKMARENKKGVGPGIFFAQEMYNKSKVPQGLIACAHGGTSMAQWSPDLVDQGGASLYGAMMRRFEKLGQPIAGILWYQGESDANEDAASLYTKKMKELVEATRKDMHSPTLPWMIVQIGCHIAPGGQYWNSIQEQQRLFPKSIKNFEVVPAIDLALADGIHISGKGHAILGKRLARLADRLVYKNKKAKPGIKLKSIKYIYTAYHPGEPVASSIEITYRNVVGSLTSKGLPTGFAIVDEKGNNANLIYKTRFFGSKVILEVSGPIHGASTLKLSYGHGRYSYCNITDNEGMSLPVMQTVPINTDMASFITKWKVKTLSGKSAMNNLTSALVQKAEVSKQCWRKVHVEQGFVVLPRPLASDRIGIHLFKACIKADKDTPSVFCFGSDSNFIIMVIRAPRLLRS